ncbi:DMT family transporter [Sabulicella glaciei]|uniref:DMT family transporter n=1 Tax=Sabulicella glaciei TaxID=2984948 RepID=A0ABT3NWC9_9PROT|nr:DMT family transporter [Roseococcus sp. MDT2-1-1]MCW8086477.1 DMT family transporter [Roseococcus sp. MDT2-1-1]
MPAKLPAPMNPNLAGMLFAAGAGLCFALLNSQLRALAQLLPPFEVQFLRYAAGILPLLPWIWRAGLAAYKPNGISGQMWRGAVHASGLFFWFTALPHIPFAEMTAIGFTTPLFIMLGAVAFLGERMIWQRWAAALLGFAGVLVVVGPNLTGAGGGFSLIMLCSSPLFAASFLITKALTRRDAPEVIVAWQSITVALFTLPFALWDWQAPSLAQWGIVLLCGVLGTLGHFLLTTAFKLADISTAQPVRFLDLIWATLLGYLVFSEVPERSTLVGGLVIFAATSWIARVEAKRKP